MCFENKRLHARQGGSIALLKDEDGGIGTWSTERCEPNGATSSNTGHGAGDNPPREVTIRSVVLAIITLGGGR
jgi:hypothetical protein